MRPTLRPLLTVSALLVSLTASADERAVTAARTSALSEPRAFSLRWGFHFAAGGFFPETAPSAAMAARLGAQRGGLGLFVEVGLAAGVGGAVSDDAALHASSASLFYLAHVTPMAELQLEPHAFAAIGLLLGAGAWSAQSSTVDAAGAVANDAIATTQRPLNFVAGLDVRLGWRFGRAANRVSVAFDLKFLLAEVRHAYGTTPSSGAIVSNEETGLGWAMTPTLTVGYDFVR